MVDIPTATDLKARYPEFEPVTDTRVTLFIEEATRRVDDTWIEADQKPAIMALTCHLMVLEGEPSVSAGGGTFTPTNLADGLYLKKRTVGDTSNEFAESAAVGSDGSSSNSGFAATVYGSKFSDLLTLNRSGMRVV